MTHKPEEIEALKNEAAAAIASAADLNEVEALRIRFLGRKGSVTTILKQLKDLPDEEKKTVGPRANSVKEELEAAVEKKHVELAAHSYANLAETEWVDVTEPGNVPKPGTIHPLTQVQEEVENAFIELGFTVVETPELESEYYNFEALNIPSYHPARDIQDTFWLDNGHLMRTHTSPIQVRIPEQYGAPVRVIQPGRCFRYEATDASHDATFYQVDGLMIDTDVTIAHLVGVMKTVLSSVFHKDVEVRVRPGYFPFVEPGLEMDFKCLLCGGKGCRVCKHTGWLEFMGCGMLHPNVLKFGNVDTKKYQGFAFGFGLSRLVMMRYGITDVRYLMSSDLRFLRQF